MSVGRSRERQYQLAAQKHNEEFLKHDYYQQTARYFERECRIAKHYDSWNYKNVDPKGELEKAKKAERLLTRRNKLRKLLKEEEEAYNRELEERNKPRSRPEESSLELLKQKLKEKRAEQSLYLPKTCRRYQFYFVTPKDPRDPRWSTLKDTNLQNFRACRDSTNFVHQTGRNSCRASNSMSEIDRKSAKEQENLETQQEVLRRPSSQCLSDLGRPNPKFSARYARRSLENTNVRSDDPVEYVPSRMSSRSSLDSAAGRYSSSNNENIVYGDNKENKKEDARLSSHREDSVIGSRPSSAKDERLVGSIEFPRLGDSPYQINGENGGTENSPVQCSAEGDETRRTEAPIDGSSRGGRDQMDKYSDKEDQGKEDVKTKDNRQFEVEKSMPWLRMNPNDKNLSKQMFMYLTHKELKCKIEDLSRRESHACNKQYWDEALRLRDMRNRLELIREKELYDMKNLDLDEEVRKLGLLSIGKRETELAERENICMDSTMYSEDAKALWKKWVVEDERSAIKDARLQREKLMNSLEKEWQNLAIRDKERISRTYQSVMTDSALQEEHKLSAAINMSKMKSSFK
ncbi:uncharacterized protein LOC143180103 [Calliopsis andreniformis]|uniref:uncharacterized protein LOC143180103 n=1 Tax=Calliopsis andreniformis TaxID=337506 RepID=UPI003FCD6F5F